DRRCREISPGQPPAHIFFEALLAEQGAFPFFEFFSHKSYSFAETICRNAVNRSVSLACRMRPVHANELFEEHGQPTAACGGADTGGSGQFPDLLGDLAAQLVLTAEYGDQICETVGLLESRKEVILLQLLVIVLDEVADDAGRRFQQLGIELTTPGQQACRF